MDDAEADVQAAPHAAGVGLDVAVRGLDEAEPVEDLGRAPLGGRRVHAVQPALEDELAAPGLGRIRRAALRDVPDALADRPGSRARSAPATVAVPDVGASSVASIRSVVVLPAPLGPRKPKIAPSSTVEVDAADGLDVAGLAARLERSAQVLRLDHEGHLASPDGLCCRAASLAPLSDIGHYLPCADSYRHRSVCQPWTARTSNSVLRSLRRVNLQGSLFGQTVAIRFGLTESDIEALEVLLDSGSATAGRLSELMGLTTGAVTRVIDRLEQAGYVRRVPDPADRRRVIVEIVTEQAARSSRPSIA